MRIARILTRLNLGGPARQALASDTRLVERGHALRLFAGTPDPGEGDLFGTLTARGLDVVRVPGLGRAPSLGDFSARRFLRRELAAFRPDVVHTHASKAGALGRSAAARLPGARVHTFHGHVLEGYFPRPIARALVRNERRLARSTDRIVAVSHATADDLVRLGVCAESQIVVVPPGVELDELLRLDARSGALRPVIGAADGALVIGVLGRLAPVKEPERAIAVFERLFARLPPGGPGAELVFIGDGPLRRTLERRIRSLPAELRPRVHLVGARPDVPSVLADLDAVLLVSRAEGSPVAVIEAAAAARAIVATPVGGVPELVADERTGLLAETDEGLAERLARLADPALRQALGHRARLRVAKRHGAALLAERLEELYRVVVEERG